MKPQRSNIVRYSRIIEMWEKGWPGKKIARYYCMSPEGVYTVIRRYMKKETSLKPPSENVY